jgi:hypothetical protein
MLYWYREQCLLLWCIRRFDEQLEPIDLESARSCVRIEPELIDHVVNQNRERLFFRTRFEPQASGAFPLSEWLTASFPEELS